MKNLFIILGLSIFAFSCTKDEVQNLDDGSMLNAELEAIVGAYEESIKDEQNTTSQKETIAGAEEIKAIQDSIKLLNNSYMSLSGKMKVDAFSDGTSMNPTPKVGVFKVSTCGDYREFIYLMDCEDGGWTYTEGNVGETSVNSNKNIRFHFCMVPPSFYNGGVLLVSLTEWRPSIGDVDVIARFHDNEDHGNENAIERGGAGFVKDFPGHCGFDKNTRFTWQFSERKTGTLPFQYGVLTNSFTEQDGTLNIDDENGGNTNYAHLWRHKASDGSTTERNLTTNERFRGISHSGNTTYHLKINNN